MRFLSLLLSLYILLITMVPCHCDDDCISENRVEIHNQISQCLQIKAQNTNGETDTCQDRCTPFCCCANQHIVTISINPIKVYTYNYNLVPQHAVLNSQYTEKKYTATLTAQKLPPEA